jgi:repressor LexA
MGRPTTHLEHLCEHVLSFDAESIEVEHKDGHQWVYMKRGDAERIKIAKWGSSSRDAVELRRDLSTVQKKALRTVLGGRLHVLSVLPRASVGDDAFEVKISMAPKPDPSVAPSFTRKQGQYLAYIYNYSRMHRQAPAETDLQRYFRVSPPSIHEMIKTLERNGLVEKTPGEARSIRLLVAPGHLPRLT